MAQVDAQRKPDDSTEGEKGIANVLLDRAERLMCGHGGLA